MIKHNAKIYLCRPDRTVICALNGVQINSVEYEQNLKDFNHLTFHVDRYLNIEGEYVESAGYEKLNDHMTIYLEGLDYFQLQQPILQNDNGKYEYKICEAYSDEKTFEDKDLKGMSFNKGTTDSMEMLATNNVDDMGYAKEYITFCNDRNHELSLMHLVLDHVPGWSVGYIDPVLKGKKYSFEADGTNAYAFLNTTVSNVVKCVFYYNTIDRTVSAFSKENIGKNTNIFIGWRNALNMLKMTPKTDTMYNALTIQGDDELDIRTVNYGRREIYNLDYYLTTDYFKQETIDKVKAWQKWRTDNHDAYIENGKKSAEYQAKIDAITYRVPNDGIKIDQYKTMDKETLEKTLKMYEQMMITIQISVDTRDDHEKDSNGNYTKWDNPDDIQNRVYKPWITTSGEIDHEKYLTLLKESNTGYYTYQELRDYIIPNIKIAIENYQVPDDKKKDYNDEYEHNWDLYGIKELEGKRDEYNKQVYVVLENYQKEWQDLTQEERDKAGVADEESYNVFHNNFVKYKEWLGDENTDGSLLKKLKELNDQVVELENLKKPYDDAMADMNSHADLNDPQFGLTDREYIAVKNIIRMGDYTNSNILVTSLDDAITSYEHCEELYQDGLKRISETSQPQYQIETSIDNILALNEYADIDSDNQQGWHNQFIVGNFIRIGIRDDYAVKLRLLTVAYNPCTKSSEINVTYTNMVTSLTGIDDFAYLFDDTAASQKNSISVGTGDVKDSIEYMSNMLQRMTGSSLFGNAVSNSVQNILNDQGIINNLFGDYLKYKVINVGNITGDRSEFNELFSKYINSEYISANSSDIKKLNTAVANINSAIIGASSTETGIIFNLSSANAKFDSAWIIDGIAGKMTIGDLKAGDITISDAMRILSDNGNMVINGSTMQFLNPNGEVGIQIGYGTSENPSIIIKDENGALLMNSSGITENAIADGLIVNNMIGNHTINKDKLSFPIIEANDKGGVDITQIYDGNGNLWGVQYTETIQGLTQQIDENKNSINNVALLVDKQSKEIIGKVSQTTFDSALQTIQNDLDKANDGVNKWLYEIYPKSLFDTSEQSKCTIDVLYSKSGILPSQTVLLDDKNLSLQLNLGDNYIAYAHTFVYFTSAINLSTKFKHNDGASIYINGGQISGTTSSYSSDGDSITLPFKSGWNCIEVIVNKGTNSDGFVFTNTISSLTQCSLMNCYFGTVVGRTQKIVDKYAELKINTDGISTKVQAVESELSNQDGKIHDLNNQYSSLEQNVNGFKTTVSNTYTTKTDFNNLEIGGVNIFVQKTVSLGYWLDNTGTLRGDTAWGYSDYINVSNMEYYVSSGFTNLGISPCTCFYNADKVFISAVASGVQNSQDSKRRCLAIPENAVYMRFSFYKSDLKTLKIEKGKHPTSYSPAPEDVDSSINSVKTVATQTAEKFNWLVKSGTSSTDFTLTDRTATLIANQINLNGLVSFSGLNSDAKTQINNNINNAIAGIEIGGRNIFEKTSYEWSDWITPKINTNNTTTYFYDGYDLSEFKIGTPVTISFDVEFSGVTASSDGTFRIYSQEAYWSSPDNSNYNGVLWNIKPIYGALDLKTSPSDGVYHYSATANLSKDCTSYDHVRFCIRCDYLASGKYRIRKVKFEIGNKATDWSPAPEDTQSQIDNVTDIIDTNKPNWDNAYSWINTNGATQLTLLDMVKVWTDGAISKTTLINGGYIKTNTITADKIAIGDFTNYSDLTVDTAEKYGFSVVEDSSASNNPWFQLKTLQRDTSISPRPYINYPCNGGETFRIKFQVSSTVQGTSTTDSSGTKNYLNVNVGLYAKTDAGNSTWIIPSCGVGDANGTVRTVSVTATLPSNARSFNVQLQLNGYNFTGVCKVRNIQVIKMSSGELIVDGAITADKIATDAITAGKIATNAIKSRNYSYLSGNYSTAGTFLDLSDGKIISKNFSIDGSGNAYFKGKIEAITGMIGGWDINNGYLSKGTWGATNGMLLCPGGSSSSKSIGGSESISGWAITASDKFGVTKDGKLYASDGMFSGTINASKGIIGANGEGFYISNSGLYATYSSNIREKSTRYFSFSKPSTNNFDFVFTYDNIDNDIVDKNNGIKESCINYFRVNIEYSYSQTVTNSESGNNSNGDETTTNTDVTETVTDSMTVDIDTSKLVLSSTNVSESGNILTYTLSYCINYESGYTSLDAYIQSLLSSYSSDYVLQNYSFSSNVYVLFNNVNTYACVSVKQLKYGQVFEVDEDKVVAKNLEVKDSAITVISNSYQSTLSNDCLTLQSLTVNSNSYSTVGSNPSILFKNGKGDQNLALVYTDYDSVKAPSCLTLTGNQGGEYFIAPNVQVRNKLYIGPGGSNIYYAVANKKKNLYYNTQGYHAFYVNGKGIAYIQYNGINMNKNIMFRDNQGITAYDHSNWYMLRCYDGANHTNTVALGNSHLSTSVYTTSSVWYNGSSTTKLSTTSSDKRLKEDFVDISKYENMFMDLNPITYKFHDGLYNVKGTKPLRTWGFIADQVIDSFNKNGLDWKDEELVTIDRDGEYTEEELKYVDNHTMLKMNYQNMISLNTHMIQKNVKELMHHTKKIDEHENIITELKNKLSKSEKNNQILEKRIYELEQALSK